MERQSGGTQQKGIEVNTSEVLNRAADLIEERGWISGEGWEHEDGGPLCLEGGILAAAGLNFYWDNLHACPAYRAVSDYLGDRTNKAPFLWNDSLAHDRVHAAIDRGETIGGRLETVRAEAREWAKREVVATLRAAALIEAAKETEAVVAARQAVCA